jgi:hypothetical protein
MLKEEVHTRLLCLDLHRKIEMEVKSSTSELACSELTSALLIFFFPSAV